MTERDELIKAAVIGLLAHRPLANELEMQILARDAIAIADQVLAEKAKQPTKPEY